MNQATIALLVGLLSGAAACARDQAPEQRGGSAPSQSKIFHLEELRWPQIDAFDRQQTLFILPVGMIEEHGPHLPVGTDTLGLNYEVDNVSRRVSAALPGWNIVVMPSISYGQSGANDLGGRLIHPGTYGIRQTTLRSLVADLGSQVAQNGFKWIFVLNGHGAPTHNIALSEAADFVSETFRVTMLHVTALLRADTAIQARGQAIHEKFFSEEELASFGMDIHAGVSETSGMLAIRPDLVDSTYNALPRQVGQLVAELREIASAPGWQGYFSDPAKASAAHGQAVENGWIEAFTDVIVRAIRGENMFGHPRFPDTVPPAIAPVTDKALASEAAFDVALQNWLAERRQRPVP